MKIKKVILVIMFVLCLLPIWYLFAYSFSRQALVIKFPPSLFPKNATLESYKQLLSDPSIGLWAINSVIVVGSVTLLSTLVSAMTGYVFALYNFKGKSILWALMLFGIMIPRISLIIPLFVVTNKMKISGNLLSCILPCLLSPVGIFLARNYFKTIPTSIVEAARIDGASDVGILLHVGIPLCGPILSALALFSALGSFSDWIWQTLQLQEPANQTLLVGLMRIAMRKGAMIVNFMGKQMAVGILLLIPSAVLFAVASKYFVSGLGGAVKE